MGAGFSIQVVNATPYNLKRTGTGSYQMEWKPSSQISPNSFTQFYAEFKETVGHYSIDDAADAEYALDGVSNFKFTIRAKKNGVKGLSTPVSSEAGYGVLVEWQNIPNGLFVYPTPDANNTSAVGWIHDGVVTIGLGYFPSNTQSKITTYPTPNYGSGGLADDQSALRPSVLHWANNWMELFAPCIQNLHLNELTLPGTHDASTYCAGSLTQSWVQTQYPNINQQLNQGIRALDLRLMLGSGSGDNQFVMCHGSFALPLTLVDVLHQVTQFLASTSKEIVILDLHDFEGNWTSQNYQDLSNLIINTIGKDKLVPPSGISQPLKDIWNTSGRVVVGAREFDKTMSDWLQQNTPFWSNSVQQYWCGTSITAWSDVQSYLQTEIDKMSQPNNFLSSLMAQYNYVLTGVPANAPKELSSFFAGLNGIKSNIIATDWWNRVNASSGQLETSVNNFSALINAVPLNILKGYRRANNLSLW
jgi:1-phosphatidylinositol phosphodiesterase